MGDIRGIYESGSPQLRGKFLSKLKWLAQLGVTQWGLPTFRELHDECAGLGEMRFKADGVQQRPLGFRSGPEEFTLLFWATEKSNRFVPRDACRIALERRDDVIAGRNLTDALWLALE